MNFGSGTTVDVSLLDQLRTAAGTVDSQFLPTSNEIPGILAALVYYTEHGDAFTEAADEGTDAVTDLLAPAPPESTEPPAETPAVSDSDLERENADLRAQLAARDATAKQQGAGLPEGTPPVEHQTGAAS